MDGSAAALAETGNQLPQIVPVHRNLWLEHRPSLDDVHELVRRRYPSARPVRHASKSGCTPRVGDMDRADPARHQLIDEMEKDPLAGPGRDVLKHDVRVHEVG